MTETLRRREESERRAGEGDAAALVFICSSGEGLLPVCTHLKGHPTAGGPGALWVNPRGQREPEPQGTSWWRRLRLKQRAAVWAARSCPWRRPAAAGKSLGRGALGELESQRFYK